MNLIKTITILSVIFLFSCSNNKDINFSLKFSGKNRMEWESVLKHYGKSKKDTLKLKAAKFLIKNMPGHYYYDSKDLSAYKKSIWETKKPIGRKTLSSLWKKAGSHGNINLIYDSHTLNADFLIDNIEKAFYDWQSAPWHNNVSFYQFCKCILPYRISDEQPVFSWRDSLRAEYGKYITDVTDIKRAYYLLYKAVDKKIREVNPKCPYTLDVLSINEMRMGNCAQKCTVFGCVLRAFGIPAAFDNVDLWANYSTIGHSWIVMPAKNDSTFYTVYGKDTLPKVNNPINASAFKKEYNPTEDFPFNVYTNKTVAKVFRTNYSINRKILRKKYIPRRLININKTDVSALYNINTDITINTNKKGIVCLCLFKTGDDWKPVTWTKSEKGKATFKNIGKNIVYLPVYYENGQTSPAGYPFILLGNEKKTDLKPDLSKLKQVTLHRKYPLFAHWTNQWCRMQGGVFEGSNDAKFKKAETLAIIKSTPVFHNIIDINNNKKFRYIRYVCPKKCRTPMAELEFYSGDSLLKGSYIGDKLPAKNIKNAFDGNLKTMTNSKKENFSIGLKLNKPQNITRIIYYPKSDLNFVEKDHFYELYYYDKKWISLGQQTAEGFSLKFDNVPANALLLLKDHSEGHEERIFTYENGKQVWW